MIKTSKKEEQRWMFDYVICSIISWSILVQIKIEPIEIAGRKIENLPTCIQPCPGNLWFPFTFWFYLSVLAVRNDSRFAKIKLLRCRFLLFKPRSSNLGFVIIYLRVSALNFQTKDSKTILLMDRGFFGRKSISWRKSITFPMT